MPCQVNFDDTLPVDCLKSVLSSVRSGNVDSKTICTALWVLGSAIHTFSDHEHDENEDDTLIGSRAVHVGDDREVQELCNQIEQNQQQPFAMTGERGAEAERAGGWLTPETLALIMQLVMLLLQKKQAA